jgi:hypothetical protein
MRRVTVLLCLAGLIRSSVLLPTCPSAWRGAPSSLLTTLPTGSPISLISTGSRPHTLSLLPLAIEFRDRGHKVTVFTAGATADSAFDFGLEGIDVHQLGVSHEGHQVVYGGPEDPHYDNYKNINNTSYNSQSSEFWRSRARAGRVSGALGLEWLDALYGAMGGASAAIVTESEHLPGFAEVAAERAGIPLEKMAVSLPAECAVNRTEPGVATKTLTLRLGALMDRLATWTVISEWRFEAGMPMVFGLHPVAPARLAAWTRTTKVTRDAPSPQLDGIIAKAKEFNGLTYVELAGFPDQVVNAVLRGLGAIGSGVIFHPDTSPTVLQHQKSRTTIVLTPELMGGKPLDREWLMNKCTLAIHGGESFLVGAAARAKITTLVVEAEDRSWYNHIRANDMGHTVNAINATVPNWIGHALLWSMVQERITATKKGNPDLFGVYP